MLHQNAILEAHDVRRNPIHGKAKVRKSPVHDHYVSFSHDRSRFALESRWDALDEVEQTLTTRPDMSAVLNVVRGPVAFSRCVVSFLKESVKSLENERLFFSTLVWFIEFLLAGKTMPFAFSESRSAVRRSHGGPGISEPAFLRPPE